MRRTAGTTVTLARYMVGSPNTRKQQVLRVDRYDEDTPCLEPGWVAPSEAKGWVASDYGYGAITSEICDALRDRATQGVPVVGDSRSRLERFHGFSLLKPNLQEAEAYIG